MIFPQVKNFVQKPGYFSVPSLWKVTFPDELNALNILLETFLPNFERTDNFPHIQWIKQPLIHQEGYQLEFFNNQIIIEYSTYQGALYGLVSIYQYLLWHKKSLPQCIIHDYPDLQVRGVMLDISRDKIPTLATLKELVTHLMLMKINHLQLYIEGFSIEYPSFPEVNRGETPLLLSEYEELEEYCRVRGIDLVGNMNSFGHMSAWLALKPFHNLAECPDGFVQWGFPFPPSTLNPCEEGSFELVKRLYADFIPYSKSKYFNLNGDEPFELGRGKSKSECDAIGMENVYVQFINLLIDEIKKYGKSPMMWADVLIHHPEAVKNLPKDVIFIDWGYDRDYPFLAHAQTIKKLQMPFILAPGTSSWNSFTSRFEDMRQTTLNAANAAKSEGGLGVLTTDWGDHNHLQYLPWSYLGFAYAAMVTWGEVDSSLESMHSYLNRFVFQDSSHSLSQLMEKMARYNDLETYYQANGTTAFKTFMFIDTSERFPFEMRKAVFIQQLSIHPLTEESYQNIDDLLKQSKRKIQKLDIDETIKSELLQTIQFVKCGIDVNKLINHNDTIDPKLLMKSIDELILIHQILWLKRNKTSGLEKGILRLMGLRQIVASL
jgi:hypothetical protein